jgi:diketogulonate reductase-like aldo/keto reductase
MPYDPRSPLSEQVHRSIQTSLHHLRPSEETREDDSSVYIDTLVLHSPLPTMDQTLEAWSTAETYVPHRIRNLGISNCTLSELETLCLSPQVKVKPAVVQNRFYQSTRYDVPLRAFCRDHAIVYQSFWTLTANPGLLASSGPVGMLAQQGKISPQAALYGLVLGLGNTTVLDGTKDESHMVADLAALQIMEKFVSEQPEIWQQLLDRFKVIIGESVL